MSNETKGPGLRRLAILAGFAGLMALAPTSAEAVKRSTVVGAGVGAVAGGVVAGPAGAVVGGVAGGYVGSKSGRRVVHRRHRHR